MSEAATTPGFSRLVSDERLTRRAIGGDDRAFAAIFGRYHQDLYRFCLAILGNREDAQDALQNTMIKVLRALPGEERKIELKPWLYRIAHNESIDLVRRRRETRELDAEQVAPGSGPAEDAATRERLRRLLTDLRELPERQREVLVMREMAGLGFAEIGTALDTSGAVIRQTLYEARLSLRQMEEGREMGCDAVTRALSDGDGRVVRRRDVRAHLRSCADCRGFRDEIRSRRQDFAALSPLSGVAAAGMLQGILGGSQAATGGGLASALGGGAAVKTIAGSAVAKGVATAAVVTAVGVGAADRAGVVHVGLPGGNDSPPAETNPEPAGGKSHGDSSPRAVRGDDVTGRTAQGRGNPADSPRPVNPGRVAEPAGKAHGKGPVDGDDRAKGGAPGPAPASEHRAEPELGHEKQRSEDPPPGQEKPAAEKAEPDGGGGEGKQGGRPATPPGRSDPPKEAKPPKESHPPKAEAPKEQPANPTPGAAPEGSPQSTETTAPGASASPGKGAENGKGHDKD